MKESWLIGDLDDLGPWKIQRHKMTQAYIDEYVKHFPKTEPMEEFDDRLWLYCL
jgi:protein-ribulosamine 3-kinase